MPSKPSLFMRRVDTGGREGFGMGVGVLLVQPGLVEERNTTAQLPNDALYRRVDDIDPGRVPAPNRQLLFQEDCLRLV